MNTELKMCSAEGCTEPRATSGKWTLCREHKNEYQRNWRAANKDSVKETNLRSFTKCEGKIYLDTHSGYYKYVGFNHPACSPSGMTRYHRIVMWDKLSGKDAPCAECGGMVFWNLPSNHVNALHVDHIDEDKGNNLPENLDPVHAACNNKRAFRNKAKRQAAAGDAA